METLKALTKDEVFFEFKDELSPGVFKTLDNFICVIMPMRINSDNNLLYDQHMKAAILDRSLHGPNIKEEEFINSLQSDKKKGFLGVLFLAALILGG